LLGEIDAQGSDTTVNSGMTVILVKTEQIFVWNFIISNDIFQISAVDDVYYSIRSSCFHCKVALYHIYLPINFDDDIQVGPLIWGSQNRVAWFLTNFVAPYLEDGAR